MTTRILLPLVLVAALAACKDEAPCTAETALEKAEDLFVKAEASASTSTEKHSAFQSKAVALQTQMADATSNPEALCAAVDELSALLD